jgi:hypothetical protein
MLTRKDREATAIHLSEVLQVSLRIKSQQIHDLSPTVNATFPFMMNPPLKLYILD